MRTLEELFRDVDTELARIGYPPEYIDRHDKVCNWLHRYAKEHGETCFSENLGEAFLSDRYGYPQNFPGGRLVDHVQRVVRAVRILGDFQKYGVIQRTSRRTKDMCPPEYAVRLQEYREYELERGLAASTVKKKCEFLSFFLCYIAVQGIMDLSMIKPLQIMNYFNTLSGYQMATIRSAGCAIRAFLSFMYKAKKFNMISALMYH